MVDRAGNGNGNGRTRLVHELQEQLLRRRDELSRAVRGELEQFQGEKQQALDIDEAAGDPNDEDTPLALLELEGNELEQIDWALQRIEQGLYGVCEECDRPIQTARLQALPFATHCVECASALEQDELGLSDEYRAAGWGTGRALE